MHSCEGFKNYFRCANTVKRTTKSATSVDVSDLNVSVTDLEKSLEELELAVESTGTSARGYYKWVESLTKMDVIMTHPGMLGQPGEAMDVIFTDTTVTVTCFGYIIWSALFIAPVVPEECSFTSKSMDDRNVKFEFSISKVYYERWNEFISGVGLNGVLTD